jgi:signal transduction histidine kinase
VIVAALDSALSVKTPRRLHTLFDVPNGIMLCLARSPVERVFFNVIGNAIDAMPHGGTIHICTREDDDDVLTAVEETGAGIPETVRDHLFEPCATWGKPEGLGLALARQTLRIQSGDLWFEPDAGTRFVIRLPIGHSDDHKE